MTIAVEETIRVLEVVLQSVPIGTNLALLRLLWAMLNGSFLFSRGAVFPALQASGFDEEESRRSWGALRGGKWTIEKLIEVWRTHVLSEGEWEAHSYEGYRPLALDWTAFWRPKLKGWKGRMFNSVAQRLLPGVGFALVADVGQVGEQRVPLLRCIQRMSKEDMSEKGLKKAALAWVAGILNKGQVLIVDAGVKISQLHDADIKQFVVRMASNCTGRRNFLPTGSNKGRPRQKGEIVRPLARTRKGKTIAASKADVVSSFMWQGREIMVQGWRELVSSNLKVDADNKTFTIWVFLDPLYQTPLVLATNVNLQPQSVFALYQDRWPVEQIPLAAKQMIGLHRQFVFAHECCWRLPELALLAGNILTYLAAVLPPLPTGFWDRRPRRTPGRLRRVLAQADFSTFFTEKGRIRKKNALTWHLPKGIEGHRRQKRPV